MLTREQINHYMKQGENSFLANEPNNPYTEMSDEGRLWLRGFQNAKFGNENRTH
jgi:hypothetical protein